MRRKLVQQGISTYTVSLPKEWVEKANLKAGDEVEIDESGMSIVVSSPQKHRKTESIIYDISLLSKKVLKPFIVAMYKAGIKDVEIKGINTETSKLIEEVVNNTVGFEILGEEKNKLNIVDLGISDEESIAKAETQIYWRLMYMIEQILENSSEEEIHEIDKQVNKLAFFIQRNLASKFSSSPNNFLVYENASVLENLGDFLRSFKMYSTSSKESKNLLNQVKIILDELRSSKNDTAHFIELKNKVDELRKLIVNNNKNDSTLAGIFLVKTLKQLFEIKLTLNVEKMSLKDK